MDFLNNIINNLSRDKDNADVSRDDVVMMDDCENFVPLPQEEKEEEEGVDRSGFPSPIDDLPQQRQQPRQISRPPPPSSPPPLPPPSPDSPPSLRPRETDPLLQQAPFDTTHFLEAYVQNDNSNDNDITFDTSPGLYYGDYNEDDNDDDDGLDGWWLVPDRRIFREDCYDSTQEGYKHKCCHTTFCCHVLVLGIAISLLLASIMGYTEKQIIDDMTEKSKRDMEYRKLVEVQNPSNFLDHYQFVVGEATDSSSITKFVDRDTAVDNQMISYPDVHDDDGATLEDDNNTIASQMKPKSSIYIGSAPDKDYGRQSIHLQSKNTYHHGLFIFDLENIPTGCGISSSISLKNGVGDEIRILETHQRSTTKVSMSLITTDNTCDMYYADQDFITKRTGRWDVATTYTSNTTTIIPTTNCYNHASYQHINNGCITVSSDKDTTLGDGDGGIFVLQWDPLNEFITSWVFSKTDLPINLQDTIDSTGPTNLVYPDPTTWGVPYAYYPVGGTHCPNHFSSMNGKKRQQTFRLQIEMDFCNSRVGRTFTNDCPTVVSKSVKDENENETTTNDDTAISTFQCNFYTNTHPTEISKHAYWLINGIYIYERG
jgi:hypothetical protein